MTSAGRVCRLTADRARARLRPTTAHPWTGTSKGARAVKFVLFTDNLADLTVAQSCESAKAAGFDGLDMTLRPGGHVRPEAAEVGMAEARRSADAAGVTIPMVSTAVTDVDSPHAEAIFAAAAHYGARLVKLGYWEYRPFGTLAAQIEQGRERLRRVVELGKKYHVLPCVHCHS